MCPFGTIEKYKNHPKIITCRYANVEKVQEAEIIGILIGTVVCDDYMKMINYLKRAILKQNKKFYEVLVGKINEPKLKNFQFIDLYVIISCPQMSMIPFKKWNIDVVTPHEVLMALQPELFPWESKIITDFCKILNRIDEGKG